MKKAIIKQSEKKEDLIPTQILAEHIRDIAIAGKVLAASPLKQKTIIVLLENMTKLPQYKIKQVLDALPQLEKEFLK